MEPKFDRWDHGKGSCDVTHASGSTWARSALEEEGGGLQMGNPRNFPYLYSPGLLFQTTEAQEVVLTKLDVLCLVAFDHAAQHRVCRPAYSLTGQ